jgi:hypothetical protein
MQIAVIERDSIKNSPKFDKIIGFCKNEYLDIGCYAKTSDLDDIYNYVYSQINLWIDEQQKNKSDFTYLGVNLIKAFEKRIFDFLIILCQKRYVIRNLIEKEDPSELWIKRYHVGDDVRFPFLFQFANSLSLSNTVLKQFADEEAHEHSAGRNKRLIRFLSGMLDWIMFLVNKINVMKENSILICSDTEKISELFCSMKDQNVVLLQKKKTVRMFWQLFKNGINSKSLFDFKISREEELEINKKANDLINRLETFCTSLKIYDRDYAPYVKKFLIAAWRNELTESLKYVHKAHSMFRRTKIKNLLVDEDKSVWKNILTQISRLYGVRSYVNIHGDLFNKIGFLPLCADYIFAWGKNQKHELKKWGLEERRIVVTGCTKYDKWKNYDNENVRKIICKNLKLSPNIPTVLFGPHSLIKGQDILESVRWSEIKCAFSALSTLKNVNFIVKTHPGDPNVEDIRKLSKTLCQGEVRVLNDYDPLMLAKGVDVMLVHLSTYSIDGLAFRKPVVLLDQYSMEKYMKLNYFYDGTSTHKIIDSINGVLSGRYDKHMASWRAAVDFCLDGMNGLASGKIAQILAKDDNVVAGEG